MRILTCFVLVVLVLLAGIGFSQHDPARFSLEQLKPILIGVGTVICFFTALLFCIERQETKWKIEHPFRKGISLFCFILVAINFGQPLKAEEIPDALGVIFVLLIAMTVFNAVIFLLPGGKYLPISNTNKLCTLLFNLSGAVFVAVNGFYITGAGLLIYAIYILILQQHMQDKERKEAEKLKTPLWTSEDFT